MWPQLILLVISAIISIALQPKQKPPQPAAFEDVDFPQTEEGTPQCVIFGDVWLQDWVVLDVGNYRTSGIYSEGGKK